MKETSRQHVLAFLDGEGSKGREFADRYREANGLKVKDRCAYCNTGGHYYTCPESDRVAFSCTNYNKKDEAKRQKYEAKLNHDRWKRDHRYAD
jgi:hypothetical protein